MELDQQTVGKVWWKGALEGAVKGIPQGIMLGAIGAALLFGGLYALGALGGMGVASSLAASFGTFLFSTGAATNAVAAGSTLAHFSLAVFNPLPIIALNTILTSVGNFLTGGDIAVNAYKQDVEHRMNEARITQIEGRELTLQQQMQAQSRTIQNILAQGPRGATSFSKAEEERKELPADRTIH